MGDVVCGSVIEQPSIGVRGVTGASLSVDLCNQVSRDAEVSNVTSSSSARKLALQLFALSLPVSDVLAIVARVVAPVAWVGQLRAWKVRWTGILLREMTASRV